MRTTITLDPDVEALVQRLMKRKGLSFKQAVNEAIRRGLGGSRPQVAFETPTRNMGKVDGVDLTKALQLAGALEDEEILRKMRAGK